MAGDKKDDRRKIARIQIRDVLAIEELSLDLDGNGLAISGRMASGKTSILDSVSAAFGKSNRAEMLRQGTDRGELLIVLDDGHQIEREVTHDGISRPVVRSPDGSVMKKPADFLAGLASALALNPVEFLNANEQRQIRMLADAFPVDVSVEELQEWAGGLLKVDDLFAKGELKGLDLVMAAVKQVSGEARNAKLLASKVSAQAKALGETIPLGFQPEEIRGISSADLATELAQIQQHNRVVQETQEKLVKIDKQEAQIRNQEQQVAEKIRLLQEELAGLGDRIKGAERAREEVNAWLSSNPLADGSPLEERLRTLDTQRGILSNYDRMKSLEAEAQALSETEVSLSSAKKKLSEFPAAMTERASIPIEGLSIEDDGIRVNGLPISNLSDGERLRLAIQIASAGASNLGVVCIDGAERMSEHEREALLSSLESQGLQFFVTEVSDEDLAIRRRIPGELKSEISIKQEAPAPAQRLTALPTDATAELAALFSEAKLESGLAQKGTFAPAAAEPVIQQPEIVQGQTLTASVQPGVDAFEGVEGVGFDDDPDQDDTFDGLEGVAFDDDPEPVVAEPAAPVQKKAAAFDFGF